MLASAAACLSRPKARISGVGMRSPPILKFWNERWVCAPHSLSAGTSIGPKESLSLRVVFCLAMEIPVGGWNGEVLAGNRPVLKRRIDPMEAKDLGCRPPRGDAMDSRIAANRRLWNEWARINQESEFYDMAGFRAGQTSLKQIELEEVGDVSGKNLLHLQCHFGQDTLSWARRGAKVTGIDLSPEAIARATALAQELGIDARFVCANVLDPKELGDAQFEIVFTSYGALNWLPDLGALARVITR